MLPHVFSMAHQVRSCQASDIDGMDFARMVEFQPDLTSTLTESGAPANGLPLIFRAPVPG